MIRIEFERILLSASNRGDNPKLFKYMKTQKKNFKFKKVRLYSRVSSSKEVLRLDKKMRREVHSRYLEIRY